jgi:hypothetical protein
MGYGGKRAGMHQERTPSLRKNVIIGHQLVKADWSKLSPTKAVKRYHFGLTQ